MNKCSSIQVCWGKRPHQNGSSPPAMLGHMIQRQCHIGLFGYPQLSVITCNTTTAFDSALELLCHKVACMAATRHTYQTVGRAITTVTACFATKEGKNVLLLEECMQEMWRHACTRHWNKHTLCVLTREGARYSRAASCCKLYVNGGLRWQQHVLAMPHRHLMLLHDVSHVMYGHTSN